MDIILTTNCNKKCEGCCYLFNKYQTGEFFDANRIIANMEKVKPAIEKYGYLSIIGGETFLYPDLVKIIEYVNTLQIERCVLFTNGTILPNYLEEMCQTKDGRYHIEFGNYGIPSVINKLANLFTQYNISWVVRPDDAEWVEHGDFIDHNEPKIEFCRFRFLTLMEERLYACGRFAQAVKLNLIPIEALKENEYVDLDDPQLFEKIDIMMEESFYTFSETCKYCLRGSAKGTVIPQGE